jgi:hypothetical protein
VAVSSGDRARLKGRAIAIAVALSLVGAFFLWLALR